jgi:phosphate/sulfate permease
MAIIVIWVLAAAFVAWIGENKSPGFWGIFFLSLILSPVIGLIIALVASPKRDDSIQKQMLHTQQQQLQQMKKPPQSFFDELLRLKQLKDDGAIDEAEYQTLKNKLIAKFD